MVCLAPRFLFLAALVATAAMPTIVLQSEARAVNLMERHHDKFESNSNKHAVSHFASKGKDKTVKNPTIPLPPSAKKKSTKEKKPKKHSKSGRKDGKRGMPLPMADMLRREADPEHHHHHHHHHDKRQDQQAQVPFSLEKRARSRIYGKPPEKRETRIADIEWEEKREAAVSKAAATDGNTWDPLDPLIQVGNMKIGDERNGEFSETHHLLPGLAGILKRTPEPHHHHHHHGHHDHDEVIVNGDNDKVHVHERRASVHGGGDASLQQSTGSGSAQMSANAGDGVEKRAPHHHHHHHHHDDHVHDKTVINGDNDDVRIHERRSPHHHHHHHHHDKTVINGDNDDVHVHNRDVGHYSDLLEANLGRKKRSDVLDANSPGVPGTVDIMSFGGPSSEKFASLILSDSEPTANSSASEDGTKETEDVDTTSSPFVLDASNTTATQFFLVAQNLTGAPSTSSASLANTLAVLKAATSTKADDPGSPDIKVNLMTPVFEPAQAAQRMYCATYDPNPSKPAPLTMERCSTDTSNSGKLMETSLHKSQTFAYNPATRTLRLMWFNVSRSDDLPSPVNSTTQNDTLIDSTSGGQNGKQMNFKIQTSNKSAPIGSLPIQLPQPAANVTQVANGTAGNVTTAASGLTSQNVTLVFTPLVPAVHSVNVPSNAPSFAPAGDRSTNSDPDGSDVDINSSSSASASATSDSSSATSTDSMSTGTTAATTSFALDASSIALGSSSDTAVPSESAAIDEAAIEKMYQHVVSN